MDDEIKGEGNSVNYKYRMHDPRVGRFFAVDPLEADYPFNSPYAFSENVVIDHIELEGLEKSTLYWNGSKFVNSDPKLVVPSAGDTGGAPPSGLTSVLNPQLNKKPKTQTHSVPKPTMAKAASANKTNSQPLSESSADEGSSDGFTITTGVLSGGKCYFMRKEIYLILSQLPIFVRHYYLFLFKKKNSGLLLL